MITSYCPGHSAYNPIEHLWAPVTKKLVSVYLQDTLPGEVCPPCEQKLSKSEQKMKEIKVFNNALKMVDEHLNHMTYRGNEIFCSYIPAASTEENGRYC